MHSVDINCDMGESFGRFRIGQDDGIFPYISSCNVACGFHAGDPKTIESTIEKAIAHGVRIGAHPGFKDLEGFGRRPMEMPAEDLASSLKYQIAAVKGLAESKGSKLSYVKPHGALYNMIAKNEREASVLIQVIKELNWNLDIMGLAGSLIEEMAAAADLPFIREAFADRRYESNGQLRSRSHQDAVIHDPEIAANQVLSMVKKNMIETVGGDSISIEMDSVCIHGDTAEALEILIALHKELPAHGIKIQRWT